MDIFVHIPKTCGSTIRGIISRQYGIDSVAYCDSRSANSGNMAAYLDAELTKREVKIITGHSRFGLHEVVKCPCRYFSMMRHPLDRAISNYFYAFSYEEHLYRDVIRSGELSFEEFLSLESREVSSSQAYMLAGPYESDEVHKIAIENIEQSFTSVGISERFDESLLYFAKTLGWTPPLYLRKNVSRLDPTLRKEREAIKNLGSAKFQELLSGELFVYLGAAERMNRWIENEGLGFQKAFDAFRELQLSVAKCEDDGIFNQYTFEQNDALPVAVARSIDGDAYRVVSDYLREPLKILPASHNYTGYLEVIQGNYVSGWATDLCNYVPIYVSVRSTDSELCRLNCTTVREDVLRSGFPWAVVGFEGSIPNPAGSGLQEWSIFFDSTGLPLPRDSTGIVSTA